MCEWMNKEWIDDEFIIKWVSDWMGGRMNELMDGCINALIN